MNISSKILTLTDLLLKIQDLCSEGKTIVFTNGCFDLIHAGHVDYLNAAKGEGDVLVLGLNSDESIKNIKGKNRPIICQEQRGMVVSAFCSVDFIVIFDEPDPLNLICAIKPHVLVKGDDWGEDKIVGADYVIQNGGRVVRIPFRIDISTSEIINTIINKYAGYRP